jgi:hypothetical protein
MQQNLAPRSVGQIWRDVRAARRRDDVEEGRSLDAGDGCRRRSIGYARREREQRRGEGRAYQCGSTKEATLAGHGGAT